VTGFWLAIVQLRKTRTAAEATTSAVEAANARMLYNHLLVLLPQLRSLEGDLDAAIAADDRTGAIKPGSTDGRWVGVGALNGECLSHQGK
jgi:hypothetical protein